MRAAILSLALLTGCASAPVVQRVEVPVPVSCVAEVPARPVIHSDDALRAMSNPDYVLAVTLDRGDLRAYANELEAVLEACR